MGYKKATAQARPAIGGFMTHVRVPTNADELKQVQALMRSFVGWHRERHQQDLSLIDAYFDAAAFEEELACLSSRYAPPLGQLLLATVEGAPAGCVALRPIDDDICEMKRMFVYPEYHGRGVGRALGEAVIGAARTAGYRVMRLDTSVRQSEAQVLYRRLGFQEIAPYYELPEELSNWLVFMELPLEA
jgi:putative acetyltransferase